MAPDTSETGTPLPQSVSVWQPLVSIEQVFAVVSQLVMSPTPVRVSDGQPPNWLAALIWQEPVYWQVLFVQLQVDVPQLPPSPLPQYVSK